MLHFQVKLTYKIRTLRTKQQLTGEAKRHACILIYLNCSPNLSVWAEQNTPTFLRKRSKTLTEGKRAGPVPWAEFLMNLCHLFSSLLLSAMRVATPQQAPRISAASLCKLAFNLQSFERLLKSLIALLSLITGSLDLDLRKDNKRLFANILDIAFNYGRNLQVSF